MPSVVAGTARFQGHVYHRAMTSAQAARPMAIAALLFVSPVLVIIVGLIVISSRGPVLVKRPVRLCSGQFAYVTEFRPWPRFDPAAYDQEPCVAKSRGALGRVLHVTSLDRLPRLIDAGAGRRRSG
jgi:putative colanic acid biosynthesis UDP-glucose lipid carrier transferase